MPPAAPRTATLEACEQQVKLVCWFCCCRASSEVQKQKGSMDSITHLAGRGGEGALLEEVERLASSEHCELCVGMDRMNSI